MRARADAAGVGHHTIDHGSCTSLHLAHPDGLTVELTADTAEAVTADAVARRRRAAAEDLARWLAGATPRATPTAGADAPPVGGPDAVPSPRGGSTLATRRRGAGAAGRRGAGASRGQGDW